MLIEEWMTENIHTVKPLDTILHAREIMTRHRINQLPVVLNGHLVGIVTDRDLRDAFPSVFDEIERELDADRRHSKKVSPPHVDPKDVTVEIVMTHGAQTLSPKDSVETAAGMMRHKRFGAIPVVDGGKLVGILTRSDVLDAFLSLAQSEVEAHGA